MSLLLWLPTSVRVALYVHQVGPRRRPGRASDRFSYAVEILRNMPSMNQPDTREADSTSQAFQNTSSVESLPWKPGFSSFSSRTFRKVIE